MTFHFSSPFLLTVFNVQKRSNYFQFPIKYKNFPHNLTFGPWENLRCERKQHYQWKFLSRFCLIFKSCFCEWHLSGIFCARSVFKWRQLINFYHMIWEMPVVFGKLVNFFYTFFPTTNMTHQPLFKLKKNCSKTNNSSECYNQF